MEALRGVLVGFRSNTTRLQVTDDRFPIELIDPKAEVIDISGRLLLPKGEMTRAYT